MVAALVVLTAIVGAGITASTAAGKTHDNVTLTVNVFGDFGYKDLYAAYMKQHPGVTIKDWTFGGSQGYPNPRRGAQPARFPTVLMIVPPPLPAIVR